MEQGAQTDGAIRSRLWRDGVLVEEDFDFARISEHLEDERCLIWVDICDPNHQLMAQLAEELELDPLAVEDAVSHAERAKSTRYPTHTFLTVYSTKLSQDTVEEAGESPAQVSSKSQLMVSRISAFVLRRGVVTVRQGESFDMKDVLLRWDENSDLLKFGVGALVHGLLDVVVDGHFEAVQVLDDSIEALEDVLFDDQVLSGIVQRRTYQTRKELVELRRVVLPMREVINGVLRHRKDLGAAAELDSYYDDLYDHVLRVSEWTESLRDMVTTVFETNLSLQDARLNNVMKKLTSWAAMIAVPTAVTGFFGQNVPYPGFSKESGFIASTTIMLALVGFLYWSFKRRDWL